MRPVACGHVRVPEAARTDAHGDVAVRDRGGYLSIVERTKDMLISGGLNVNSKEVDGR